MPTQEFYYTIAMSSFAFSLIYSFASFYSNDIDDDSLSSMVLRFMPFVTRSIGILWPISGFLLLCSYIFEGVAGTQGVEIAEAPSFNKGVLVYSGCFTLLFGSPLMGYIAGRVYRAAKTARSS
jgi:hypothetical protein